MGHDLPAQAASGYTRRASFPWNSLYRRTSPSSTTTTHSKRQTIESIGRTLRKSRPGIQVRDLEKHKTFAGSRNSMTSTPDIQRKPSDPVMTSEALLNCANYESVWHFADRTSRDQSVEGSNACCACSSLAFIMSSSEKAFLMDMRHYPDIISPTPAFLMLEIFSCNL
jgi:hypothetical protein